MNIQQETNRLGKAGGRTEGRHEKEQETHKQDLPKKLRSIICTVGVHTQSNVRKQEACKIQMMPEFDNDSFMEVFHLRQGHKKHLIIITSKTE